MSEVSMRRWLIVGHAWVGFVLSLIMAIVAITGTLLVFKDDWTRLTVPGAETSAPLDIRALAGVAKAAEDHFGAHKVSAIRFATPDLGVHRLYLADGGGAWLDGSGQVMDQWAGDGRLMEWMLTLHYKLMTGETGEVVVGVAGLVAIALVISGFIIWWPVRRSYRNRFWPRSTRRTELLRTHRDTGIWGAIPILVLSVSGAAMIFNTQALALFNGLLGGTASPTETTEVRVTDKTHSSAIDWYELLLAGKEQFPQGKPRIISWPRETFSARIRYKQPAEWHPNGRSVLQYDARQGVIEFTDATESATGTRVFHAMYPVHSARIGGPLYATLVALAGAGLTSLALFGMWSFVKLPGRKIVPQFVTRFE